LRPDATVVANRRRKINPQIGGGDAGQTQGDDPQDRPDRRVLLCGRDEEVGFRHAELLSAREGRDADALLGQSSLAPARPRSRPIRCAR